MWDDKRIFEDDFSDDFSDDYRDGSFEYGNGEDAELDNIINKLTDIEM